MPRKSVASDVTRKFILGLGRLKPMASVGVRAYNRGLGVELPVGSRGLVRVSGAKARSQVSGAKPPEADS